MITSETFQLGPYSVRVALRHDNPAWPSYVISRGDKIIGKSFSRPDLGCCQWLETQQDVTRSQYAEPSPPVVYGYSALTVRRRGRPRKADAERELQEAMST